MIGVLNAHMFGMPSEPGEHVDWSGPDFFTGPGFADLVGMPVEVYAETSPHMIVWEAGALLDDQVGTEVTIDGVSGTLVRAQDYGCHLRVYSIAVDDQVGDGEGSLYTVVEEFSS